MPPRWALGYHNVAGATNLKSCMNLHGIPRPTYPLRCHPLDIDYMRLPYLGRKRFPTQLVSDLARDGFKTVTIIDPGVKYEPEANYHVFDQG